MTALGNSFSEEVDAICDMVVALSQGFPPQEKDIPNLAPLAREILKKTENFCVFDPKKVGPCPRENALGGRGASRNGCPKHLKGGS